MNNISKKTCFPSARKVLDFDLNGQIMRKTEVTEGNWVPGCSPDHSTIRPKILSLSQVRKTCFSTEGRKQWFSFACGVVFFAAIEHFPNIFCTRLQLHLFLERASVIRCAIGSFYCKYLALISIINETPLYLLVISFTKTGAKSVIILLLLAINS